MSIQFQLFGEMYSENEPNTRACQLIFVSSVQQHYPYYIQTFYDQQSNDCFIQVFVP